MLGLGGEDEAELAPTCSRAGCAQPAAWRVNWRNQRIHTIDRVKVWLACDEHRDFLHEYLASRGFPVLVTTLQESVDFVPDPAADPSSPDRPGPAVGAL
jgi:hypothetical protein